MSFETIIAFPLNKLIKVEIELTRRCWIFKLGVSARRHYYARFGRIIASAAADPEVAGDADSVALFAVGLRVHLRRKELNCLFVISRVIDIEIKPWIIDLAQRSVRRECFQKRFKIVFGGLS